VGERRSKHVALLAVGIAVGAVTIGTPAGAHVGGTVKHLWNHLKPKADARYVNASENPWAIVDSAGTVVRGNRVVSATRVATGQFEVIFDRGPATVRTCAYVATLATPDFGTVPGEISAASRSGNPNGVFVRTWDSTGTAANLGFHLAVLCPGAPL